MHEPIQRLIDTDVASDLTRRLPDADTFVPHLRGFDRVISFITLGEMLRGARRANWSVHRTADMERSLLDEFRVLPYSANVAREWGRLVGTCMRSGFTPGANDAWIAASALAFDCTLVARDAAFKTMAQYEPRLRVVP